ncbi:MAG TPA: hypothetical protein VGQ87_00860 [Patescibacteria group bacterium]|jgi:hypothetical protein|nr:hypothetical protein [Patescibacteria group bacterium]
MESRNINKSSGSNFIVVILAVIIAVLGYFFLKSGPKTVPPPPQISGLEIASKTIGFLNKTLQPDGSFLYGYSCDKSIAAKCVLSPNKPPHSGQGILAYYFLAKATGDQSLRNKADLSINYMLNQCAIDVQFCEWNYFPIYEYYKDTGEQKYLEGMKKPAEGFLIMADKDVIANNVGLKLGWLFDATKDVRYKNRLLAIADAELKKFPGDSKQFLYPIQVAWSIFLPSYNITKDQKYLSAMEKFFDDLNVPDNLQKFKDATSVAKAADVLFSLSAISDRGKIYKAQAHKVLQELLFQLWDTPQNLKFDGDYGFIDNLADADKADKSMLFNGGLLQAYLRFGTGKFEEPKLK